MDKQIQWFPGHMAKTLKELQTFIQTIDVIIELRDSRCPLATTNLLLSELKETLPKIVINTKKDLADPKKLTNLEAVDVHKIDRKAIIQKIESKVLTKRIKAKNRGIKSIIIRCLVVGIPNVGKSTFINKVVNKSLAKTANIPGFTKSITIYKLNDEIEIVDTPGLLYSKFTDRLVGLRLALIGSIKEDILPINEVFDYYLEIMKKYSANFLKKYNVEPDNPQLISIIGNNKGLLFKEGLVDEQTTKKVLIKEFQKGLVGRISLE